MAAYILKNGLDHPKTAFFQNKVLQIATDIDNWPLYILAICNRHPGENLEKH